MSTNLYWAIKIPAPNLLPIQLKWALQNIGRTTIPSIEWLQGFILGRGKKELDEETRALTALYEAMESGQEIELEWK